MRKLVLLYLVCSLSVLAGGCSKSGDSVAEKKPVTHTDKSNSKSVHGNYTSSDVPGEKMLVAIKGKALTTYPNVKVGDAFDGYRYLADKTWVVTYGSNSRMYVDFTGWFDPKTLDKAAIASGVKKRGLEIKFVIVPSGSFYVAMVSKADSAADGTIVRYPLPDIKGILDAIYANKEIAL